jgi:hypothetical protein
MTAQRSPEAIISRRRVLQTGVAFTAAGAVTAAGLTAAQTAPFQDIRAIQIQARAITHFERARSSVTRFGALEFRGGLVLTSSDTAFGGLSGLVVAPDGGRILSISDEGAWLAAEIVYGDTGPMGLRNAKMGPLQGIGGRVLNRKRDLDAESIALLDGDLINGTALVGFERKHRITRFPIVNGVLKPPTGSLPLPAEARRMSSNKGFEAVTVLRGGPYKGAVIAFSERLLDKDNRHTGWLWVKGEPKSLHLPDIDGFDLTDAASLADGTLLLLERRFRWTEGVQMRIRRFAPDTIKPGAVLEGGILISAGMTYEIDNMEGLAVHRNARGETILTLISDDNFNHFLQRTILLQFALVAEPPKTAAPR